MSVHIIKNATAVLVGATLLAGCGSTGHDHTTTGSVVGDYRTNHPIIIADTEQTLDVPVATGARTLSRATRSNITAFARRFVGSGTGVMQMLVPSGSPNMYAVDQVRGEIVAAIEAGGADRGTIALLAYDASAHGPTAPVRLSYAGITATTPKPCGQWPEDLSNTAENAHYWNYGCSMQSNLAAQIANPVDLLGPRAMTPVDATQRGAAIETYQQGPQPKPSEITY